jgi:hypothetical protein
MFYERQYGPMIEIVCGGLGISTSSPPGPCDASFTTSRIYLNISVF